MKEIEEVKVTSPAFEENGWIPQIHSGYGEDFSPELVIEGLSDNAVSLVITLDDLDHPLFPGYNHWIAWNLPAIALIPQNLPKGEVIETPIHAEQGKAYGTHCYRGPKPPFHWCHRYLFTVYVLDITLAISQNANKEDVMAEIEGHILQCGELCGKYQRNKA